MIGIRYFKSIGLVDYLARQKTEHFHFTLLFRFNIKRTSLKEDPRGQSVGPVVQLGFDFTVNLINYDIDVECESSAHIRLLAGAGEEKGSSPMDPDSISIWFSIHLK